MSSAGQYVRLETLGRRSGAPHDVLVRFVTVDGKLYVFPQNAGRQDWMANVLANPKVKVFGEGRSFDGVCRVKMIKGVHDPLLGIFTRKYGVAEVKKRYWGQRKYVEIEMGPGTAPSDYSELVYADLEAAFDGVAEGYDQHIMGNPMNLWLRNRSVSMMKTLFKAGQVVLEIGCGTGTETIPLAESGVTVLAVDVSSKMLGVLSRKAAAAGVEDRIVPIHCRPDEIRERAAAMGHTRVDGAYSTYGAVNTEPRLPEMFRDIHAIMAPGGKLLLGVWNKYCAYEMVGYSVRMRPSMTVARLRNPVPVGKSRFCVTTTAYSVGGLSRMLDGLFRLDAVRGVEVVLPPSNLISYLPPEPILGFLEKVELAMEDHYPWSRLGDHFLGVYSRVG